MPRRRTTSAAITTRDQALKALLADPWAVIDGMEAPELNGLSDREKADVLHEAKRELWRRREMAREPELIMRLNVTPPSQWAGIFCERPDLERRLSFEQRQQWRDWLASRDRLKAGGPVIVPTGGRA